MRANKPDAVNPAMALRLAIEDQCRRVTDLERSARLTQKTMVTWRPCIDDLRRLVSFALGGLAWMALFPSLGLASRAQRGVWFAVAFLPVILVCIGTGRHFAVASAGWALHLLVLVLLATGP
jgi:hypothetical protein